MNVNKAERQQFDVVRHLRSYGLFKLWLVIGSGISWKLK